MTKFFRYNRSRIRLKRLPLKFSPQEMTTHTKKIRWKVWGKHMETKTLRCRTNVCGPDGRTVTRTTLERCF